MTHLLLKSVHRCNTACIRLSQANSFITKCTTHLEGQYRRGYLVGDMLHCEVWEAAKGHGLVDDGEGSADHGLTSYTCCCRGKHEYNLQAHHKYMVRPLQLWQNTHTDTDTVTDHKYKLQIQLTMSMTQVKLSRDTYMFRNIVWEYQACSLGRIYCSLRGASRKVSAPRRSRHRMEWRRRRWS